jgi:hypothetical protein
MGISSVSAISRYDSPSRVTQHDDPAMVLGELVERLHDS